jgi:flavorubredoxin
MKIVMVYSSRYGNGKKCVDCVNAQLKAKGHEVQILNAPESNPAQIPPADMYIFSGAAEAFSIAKGLKNYLVSMPVLEGRKYALINTHGMKKPRALPKMEKILSGKKKMIKVGEIDFRVGDGAQQGNGLPEGYQAQLASLVDRFG